MSVIINGFNMPDTCEKCLFARWSNVNQTSSCALVLSGEKCFEMYSVEYRSKRSDICPLTPVHPEPSKTGKWIPCKEKLPQEDEPVLVTGRGGRQHVWNITRTVAEYLGGLCWEDDYGYYQDLDDAVAWQPLPEPYTKEEEDG